MDKEHKLIQSYYKEKYFISTAYRRASVAIHDVWYYETIIWELDKDMKQRGKMISMHDSTSDPILARSHHFDIIIKLDLLEKSIPEPTKGS